MAATAPDGASRLVWRLFSPSSHPFTCEMRARNGGFELLISDDEHAQIARAGFQDLTALHETATRWRSALEARGTCLFPFPLPQIHAHAPPAMRAARSELVECAELLTLDQRDVGSALREAARTGLVALGIQDAQMTDEAIAMSREVLQRAAGRRRGGLVLVKRCEALLTRVEAAVDRR